MSRLTSLDAFRGLVILTMTFVNYLAGVKNIPAWAKHMPSDGDGYTFVDVVFPAFLFIVGVAIPLALHKRMARGESLFSLLQRVLVRSASLLFVGVIMVNSRSFSADATGMSKSLWFLLAMLAVVVLWNIYPADAPKARKRLFLGLRIFAGLVLAGLLVVFRGKNSAGEIVWLQHSWWGILGLIGWAYLVCCLAYLAFRGSSVALMGVLGFLIALFIGDKHGVARLARPRPQLRRCRRGARQHGGKRHGRRAGRQQFRRRRRRAPADGPGAVLSACSGLGFTWPERCCGRCTASTRTRLPIPTP